MRVRVRSLAGVLAAVALWLGAMGQAYAVSLGKIDVTSHLGEAFYAEVPLTLKAGEGISDLSVELAASSDYRVLEVYRDPAMSRLRANIVSDMRGDRIGINSEKPIEAPFFNLVLKVRHGRVTQFKKYPVFLDLPRLDMRTTEPEAVPVTRPVTTPSYVAPSPVPFALEEVEQAVIASSVSEQPQVVEIKSEREFKPFDDWARIRRYGPMVYGDTLSIVAQRLRTDDRYSLRQVMAALFSKNSDKFIERNMNMVQVGTHLDVPTTREVEENTPEQARAVVAEHSRQWRELKKLPRYAAISEAQKHRYSKRVRVGKQATGEPATLDWQAKDEETGAARTQAGAGGGAGELAALRQQNEKLTQQLQESEDAVSQLKSGMGADADMMAASERIKKLELKLARLQTELAEAREQAVTSGNEMMNWITYGLAGLAVLLLMALGFLMRRERPHPATAPESGAVASEVMSSPDMAAPAADLQLSEQTVFAEEPPQDQVEPLEQPVEKSAEEEAADIFSDKGDEEVDPDADYLVEADVYLRYGMDDEAIHQTRMAIRQRESNTDAHCKLIQTLYAQEDKAEMEKAIAHGASVLKGDSLRQFEEAVSSLDMEDEEAAEIEALPTMEYSSGEDQEASAEADDESEEGLDLTSGQAGETTASGPQLEDENLELGDLEWAPGTEDDAQEDIVAEKVVDEIAPGTAEEELESQPEEASTDDSGDLGFTLSDDDMAFSGEDKPDEPTEAQAGKTGEEVSIEGEAPSDDAPAVEEGLELPEGEMVGAAGGISMAGAVTEDEQPSPNVDYLAEADVYLRYGMDDEAIHQVRMAIRQRESNTDAHCKLIQTLHMQENNAELEKAIVHGANVLKGDDLKQFEEAVSSLDIEDEEAAEIEVLPTREYSSGEDQEIPAGTGDEAAEEGLAGEATVSGMQLEDENLELDELEWTPESETGEAGSEPQDDALEDVVAEESVEERVGETLPANAEEVPETQPEETSADELGELDFTLADDDMAGETKPVESAEGVEEELLVIGASDEPDEAQTGEIEEDSIEGEAPSEDAPAAEGLADLELSGDETAAEAEGGAFSEEVSLADSLELASESDSDEAVQELDVSHETFDVSKELDGLLAELSTEDDKASSEQAEVDVSSESLNVDMARSQLAKGDLEAAEQSFTAALDSGQNCEALLGLADIAMQRGEDEAVTEFLAKAESLLDDATRPWYEQLTGKLSG